MGMEINYTDQRKDKATEITVDMDTLYILAEKAGIPDGTKIRFRLRDGNGPYGFTSKLGENEYRVVINLRYDKPQLSESAQYVVNNTVLHELRHVAQGEESGWHSLSGAYEGWSETEAREYGRTIKGEAVFYALR